MRYEDAFLESLDADSEKLAEAIMEKLAFKIDAGPVLSGIRAAGQKGLDRIAASNVTRKANLSAALKTQREAVGKASAGRAATIMADVEKSIAAKRSPQFASMMKGLGRK